MKSIAMAIALMCVFTVPTFAGDIPSVPVQPPPAPSAIADNDGDIPSVPGPNGGLAQTITDEFLLAIFGMFAK